MTHLYQFKQRGFSEGAFDQGQGLGVMEDLPVVSLVVLNSVFFLQSQLVLNQSELQTLEA